jgi:hypothetical protein
VVRIKPTQIKIAIRTLLPNHACHVWKFTAWDYTMIVIKHMSDGSSLNNKVDQIVLT